MALLELSDVHAAYDQVQVLRGLSLHVDPGEIVVLLGANGAGKTTTLRAICGLVRTRGSITFAPDKHAKAAQLVGRGTEDITRLGIAHVPQGRGIFGSLTVEENMRVGAWSRKDRAAVNADLDQWFEVFPRLRERREQPAGTMSGGEQQMLAIARAMMAKPRLLLLDEPSLGLAQLITRDLFERLGEINSSTGMAMLIVEQNAELALGIAARGYAIEAGELVLSGSADEMRANDEMRRAYLGY